MRGLNLLTEYLGDQVQDSFDGMPYAMFQMISLLGIPTAVNIMLSALTARVVIKGLMSVSGTARKKPTWECSGWRRTLVKSRNTQPLRAGFYEVKNHD